MCALDYIPMGVPSYRRVLVHAPGCVLADLTEGPKMNFELEG